MRWRSRGRILTPPVAPGWGVSHAALPTVEALDGDIATILFAARDDGGRSSIGRAHVSLADHTASIEDEPVLGPGRLGTFDDSGVTPSCVVAADERRFLFYTGWSRGRTVPFHLFAGVAVAKAGGRYERTSEAPVLERTAVDPLLTASPWVLVEDGRWRMWYVSATRWEVVDGEARHWYHLRYAESDDGLSWRREGLVALDFAGPDEHAFSRPSVIRDGDRYRMWFSARGDVYRLGYAESDDGFSWRRDDTAAALAGVGGWDAEMQAYPAVFELDGRLHLLYNGNGYGTTGIGHAILAPF